MTSKYPVKLKDGSEVRPIDVFVATLAPNPPADELARLALAGEITDYGVVTVDCIGEKNGKPASVGYYVFPPDIKWVNGQIPGATCVSYGTSTPASIYAEFIVEDRIAQKGMICPEELHPRACATRSSPRWACATCRPSARRPSPPTERRRQKPLGRSSRRERRGPGRRRPPRPSLWGRRAGPTTACGPGERLLHHVEPAGDVHAGGLVDAARRWSRSARRRRGARPSGRGRAAPRTPPAAAPCAMPRPRQGLRTARSSITAPRSRLERDDEARPGRRRPRRAATASGRRSARRVKQSRHSSYVARLVQVVLDERLLVGLVQRPVVDARAGSRGRRSPSGQKPARAGPHPARSPSRSTAGPRRSRAGRARRAEPTSESSLQTTRRSRRGRPALERELARRALRSASSMTSPSPRPRWSGCT